ncbi:flagellar motor protein MotB [Dokdonia sp. Hel_I_53]|uniref:OmpA/MotB family protein n=1 Tax=Dokdonia sp. Hel_I_53 TaxID=1566287 RepID=UPI00119EBCED|nr:flagellar motor protein MotB [Dokdonia sp. Hel_I_53]
MMNSKTTRNVLLIAITAGTLTSCVSKKKYTQLQSEYDDTKVTLVKTTVEKEEIEAKYAAIEARVENYNSKINSLQETNDAKFDITTNGTVISEDTKKQLRTVLANVDPSELAQAETLEDSMNLAVSYKLKRNLDKDLESNSNPDDIAIDIDNTVVMISISDKMLFRSGSYRMSKEADDLLQRIATVVNSEPAVEVMVEGHTDSRTVKKGSHLKDNWDLSVQRATSIVRELQNRYNVDPSKLIASGRSSYVPLVPNDSKENMAKNRRTKIIILPNLDKFLALMASNE